MMIHLRFVLNVKFENNEINAEKHVICNINCIIKNNNNNNNKYSEINYVRNCNKDDYLQTY